MSFLRSAHLIALQTLLVTSKKTVDHFRDAAEFVGDQVLVDKFLCVAQTREKINTQLEQAIQQLDDLPIQPDEDLETGEKLLNRARASFAADETDMVLHQRLAAEEELTQQLRVCATEKNQDFEQEILQTLIDDNAMVINQLTPLLKK